jgi:hypothetical protein
MSSIFYLYKPSSRIFPAIIKESADDTETSSVPVITTVGIDIFVRSSQMLTATTLVRDPSSPTSRP